MLAVAFDEFGGPEVLKVMTLPDPVANAGEVVVKVVAATVNPSDTLMRSGQQAAAMVGLKPPYVAGMEFAGHVHSLGGGVSRLAVGQPVMGVVNPRRPARGAHAQYVLAPAGSLAPLDPATDLYEAATVPMNGITAKGALEALNLPRGHSLLVTGGAGALGGYVIQLAKDAGLTVIADARDSDVDLIRRLGADHIAPRGEAMGAAVRRLYPQGVDGLVDAALLGAPAAALVRDGGVAVWVRKSHAIADPRLNGKYLSLLDYIGDTAGLAWLGERMREGGITPRVALRLPMTEAVRAHRLVEQGGLRGRVVLTFSDADAPA